MQAFGDSGPDAAVVYCDMLRIPLEGDPSYHHSPAIKRGRLLNPVTGFYQTYGLGSQSALIRRRLLDRPDCFDGQYRCLEDLEMLLRLAQRFEFVHIPEALFQTAASLGGEKARSLLLDPKLPG